jgi:hypothetical protein
MTTPRTEAVIVKVMAEYPGESPKELAKYYEAVHQEIAPLCRELEREVATLKAQLATQQVPEGFVLVKRSAIEYANHMADCAEEFKAAVNAADEAYNSGLDAETDEEETAADIRHTNAVIDMSEARNSLNVAIYEYRKRVPAPSAQSTDKQG